MASFVYEDEFGFGFDEGMLHCLPSNVVHEACLLHKVHTRHCHQNHHQLRHQKSSAESQFVYKKGAIQQRAFCKEVSVAYRKYYSRSSYQRPKVANGGYGGMQAIFLESGKRSCGTGVFLPQTAGTNFQTRKKKPGCAPVLLPNRVIQALNLNVHALGLQISPCQEPKYEARRGGEDFRKAGNKKKKCDQKNGSKHDNNGVDHGQCQSMIFLPKEWTY